MAIQHEADIAVQIGSGGIWVPLSIAEQHHLPLTRTSKGQLVEDPPIPSVVVNRAPVATENILQSRLGPLETEIEIPRPMTRFLERIGDALLFLSPRYTFSQLRNLWANS